MEKVYLIIDAANLIGQAITDRLLQDGCTVVAHSRTSWPEDTHQSPKLYHVHAPDVSKMLDAWIKNYGSFTGVVFNVLDDDEGVLFDAGQIEKFADHLESSLCTYLSELQVVSSALMRGDGGQVWVLTYEDSLQYYLPIPWSPVASRARISAVKSMAKEVARLGVLVNAAAIQTPLEMLSKEQWNEKKKSLKAFTTKFKPMTADAIASLFSGMLQNSTLPMVGVTVTVGAGLMENNL